MSSALKLVNILINAEKQYQEIDGFGVNINSQYWDNGNLVPVLDLLIDDLGATLFRQDIYGKSNWIDPDTSKNASILNKKTYKMVYTNNIFKNGWAMAKYLNKKGIQPYITASGDVPEWMLAEDKKTLSGYDDFAEMMVSFIDWACNHEKIKFKYFGPLNETDLGSPEGPLASPRQFVKAIAVIDKKLKTKELKNIKFVVAEQSNFS